MRRVAIDDSVAMNRDRAQQAEALARGGVRLAEVILLEDLRTRGLQGGPDSRHDIWARAGDLDLIDDPDVDLHVRIEDAAARINLNGFLKKGAVSEDNRLFLQQFPRRRDRDHARAPRGPAIRRARTRGESRRLDRRGRGDEPTARPRARSTRAAIRPSWSRTGRCSRSTSCASSRASTVALVEALKPFVGVYPLVGGGGVNLNTAPPWVLIQTVARLGGERRLRPLEEKDVRRIVDAREEGPICGGEGQDASCTPLTQVLEGDDARAHAHGTLERVRGDCRRARRRRRAQYRSDHRPQRRRRSQTPVLARVLRYP